MSIFRKTVRIVMTYTLMLVCSMMLSACSVIRDAYKDDTVTIYRDNYEEFKSIVETAYSSYASIGASFVFNVKQIDVPQSMTDIGVCEIFIHETGIYFEFSKGIMGATTQGILYSEDLTEIEDWYKIEAIDGNWYYYRVVS